MYKLNSPVTAHVYSSLISLTLTLLSSIFLVTSRTNISYTSTLTVWIVVATVTSQCRWTIVEVCNTSTSTIETIASSTSGGYTWPWQSVNYASSSSIETIPSSTSWCWCAIWCIVGHTPFLTVGIVVARITYGWCRNLHTVPTITWKTFVSPASNYSSGTVGYTSSSTVETIVPSTPASS